MSSGWIDEVVWIAELVMTESVVLQHAADEMGAKCIDGTPATYHISRGYNSKKWLIYHEVSLPVSP
eukprot:6232760-Pyramimonas_sp.AAC.2